MLETIHDYWFVICLTEVADHDDNTDCIKPDDEDSDIELEVYRENYSNPVAPPTVEPLYQLQDNGRPPGEQTLLFYVQSLKFDTCYLSAG